MGNQECDSIFDQIYNLTYTNTLRFVTARCGDPGDISDILQEVYAELYRVLLTRGTSYILQPEAFVTQLARSKVYRHYTLREKIKNIFPASSIRHPDSEEGMEGSFETAEEGALEELVADRILLQKIAEFIKTKPGDVQKIFYLYYVLEQSSSQIAKDLHLHESTVKSKIYRTVREVRALYGKVGTDK